MSTISNESKYKKFDIRECILKCRLQNDGHLSLPPIGWKLFFLTNEESAWYNNLTHCGPLTSYMVKEIWVNIGTGNGLLPVGLWDNYDCLKLHQANVDFSFVRLFGIHIKKKTNVTVSAQATILFNDFEN